MATLVAVARHSSYVNKLLRAAPSHPREDISPCHTFEPLWNQFPTVLPPKPSIQRAKHENLTKAESTMCLSLKKKKKRRTTNPTKPTPTERMLYLEGSGSWSVAFYQLPTAERASGSSQKWTHYSCREQVPAATAGLLPTLALTASPHRLVNQPLSPGAAGLLQKEAFPYQTEKGAPTLFEFSLLPAVLRLQKPENTGEKVNHRHKRGGWGGKFL